MRKSRFSSAMMLLALTTVGGCSSIGKPYSQIDPAGALEDVRQHNGYYKLKSVAPGTAKLIVRSAGEPKDVAFSVNSENALCEGYKDLGLVRDAGRGVLYPWIANLGEIGRKGPLGYAESELAPGHGVIVRGYGSWANSTTVAGSGTTSSSFGSCGPRFVKFTPQEGRAYLVEFLWTGNSCKQNVVDATDPDAPVAVQTETMLSCQK